MPRFAAALPLMILACTPAPDAAVLLAADSAFDAAVASGGSQAWVDTFADGGAMIQEGVGEIRGQAAILEAVGYLDQPDMSLRWTPDRADIAASGDLGWTTGSYVFRATDPEGNPIEGRGRYVSIWRRQEDGRWKVVMDLGNPVDGAGAD